MKMMAQSPKQSQVMMIKESQMERLEMKQDTRWRVWRVWKASLMKGTWNLRKRSCKRQQSLPVLSMCVDGRNCGIR